MKLLIIEDGREYTELVERFLPAVSSVRAGSGAEALAYLSRDTADAVFLDMRFDRVPDGALLGDLVATAERLSGDPDRARAHLQDHQGTYILYALREAGHSLPVLLSYDFSLEPRRWARIAERRAPVDYIADLDGPGQLEGKLRALVGSV